jgi:hypothetical protein
LSLKALAGEPENLPDKESKFLLKMVLQAGINCKFAAIKNTVNIGRKAFKHL